MTVSRRGVLAGAALASATLASATLAGCGSERGRPDSAGYVAAVGDRQAGVDRPAPQAHAEVAVFDLPGPPRPVLARLGAEIVTVASGAHERLAGLAPAAVTVTVGLGPRLAGIDELPVFARENMPAAGRGGDLMVQVCAEDPLAVSLAMIALIGIVGEPRWSQRGFRAERNLLGFRDGLANPRTRAELDREVWRPDGSTVAVVRRLRLDIAGFARLPLAGQEAAVGRTRAEGRPLSGAVLDLGAKTPDGQYLVPALAHVRRAHPRATGSGRMLRRGYHYDNGAGDRGLLFASFQREVRTFVATQRRLDDGDALMDFATATAGGVFVILPGFDVDRPLGCCVR